MRKLLKDCRGAVTVMVTLLLIPALLVSGTCVDVARSYAAKSALQDGNRMGANAWLTQYDALLQDIYGLFGVYANDDELSGDGMLRDYIKASVLGPEDKGGLGFFDLFYDSELTEASLKVTKDLGNVEVLRNQIEEYAKFRAPVAIASELLENLERFEKLKADASAVKDKVAIDKAVGDIEETYKAFYDKLREIENETDGYPPTEAKAFREINAKLKTIKEIMDEIKSLQSQLASISDEDDDAASRRAALRAKINQKSAELKKEIAELQKLIEFYCDRFEDFKGKISSLVDLGRQADAQKKDLEAKLDALDEKLSNGTCSKELSGGMSPSLEEYRELLKYDIEEMAQDMVDEDNPYIDSIIEMLKNISLGSSVGANGAKIEYTAKNYPKVDADTTNLGTLMDNSLKEKFKIEKPTEGDQTSFKYFRDFSGDAEMFYKTLDQMFSKGSDRSEGETTKAVVKKLLQNVKEKIKKGFSVETAGASRYPGSLKGAADAETVEMDLDSNWEEGDNAENAIGSMLDSPLLDRFSDLAASVGNKALLLVYDTEMFSNYTSPNEAGAYDLTMSNIPMNTRVNYFFQSELEYLFHGNKDSAPENLTTVAMLLLLVRTVMNYVSSFMIPSVQGIVTGVEGALVLLGPFAFAVGALVRTGLVLGESFLDVVKLRSGDSVPLIKMQPSEWTFGGTGLVEDLMNTGEEAIAKLDSTAAAASSAKKAVRKAEPGSMTYRDYVRIFLLLVEGNTLARRTGNLISLNITNYKTGNNAAERAMDLMKLSQFGTCISISSTLELRFIFLSMGYAQKGINGVVPPRTMTLKSTEYRGY